MPDMHKTSPLKAMFLAILGGRISGAIMQKIGGSLLRNLPGQITCQQFEDFLIEYLEDRLTVAQRILFERHMKVCPMCRTSLKSYLKVIEMGQAICAEDQKDEVFTEAPQELIDAIIDVSRQRRPD